MVKTDTNTKCGSIVAVVIKRQKELGRLNVYGTRMGKRGLGKLRVKNVIFYATAGRFFLVIQGRWLSSKTPTFGTDLGI